MRTRWMAVAVVVAGMWLAAAPAYAQKSDADWLAQCKEQRDGKFRHCEVRPVALAAGGLLHVDARPNGGVHVTGWDQAKVAGSARIQVQADNEADARALAGRIVIDTSTGTLRANGPQSGDGRSWAVSFVLSAPRHADVQADSVNGPVAISGIAGQVRATAVNGPISLRDVGGDVRARTTNGPVDIVLSGSAWDGAGLDAETMNGPVTLSVPDGYSAQLEAATVNGPLRLGIPVTVQGDILRGRTRSINGPIGAGGARIRVATTNGPVTIEKR